MRSLAILLLLLSVSAVKAQFPEVTTTQAQVIDAHSKLMNNENWFLENGFYSCLFRNTPVAINHAFARFEEVKKKYKALDCTEKDIISSNVKKADGTLDFERLVNSVFLESSEIERTCLIPDGPVKAIRFVSMAGRQPLWMILVVPRE